MMVLLAKIDIANDAYITDSLIEILLNSLKEHI